MFSALQQKLILTALVDNSAESTGYDTNEYACESTNDKVFLLSYEEVTNSEYGFNEDHTSRDEARYMQTSDYSRATGATTTSGSSSYIGNGKWWLRSPCFDNSARARYVDSPGLCGDDSVYTYSLGVVPALQSRLQ